MELLDELRSMQIAAGFRVDLPVQFEGEEREVKITQLI